jgi:hypothetical protein
MSKYRIKSTPKKQALSAQDVKDEKQFMKVAILVTVIAVVLIYLIFNYL